MAAGLDSLDDIAGFIKSNYGFEIPKQMLSSYKSQQKARDAKQATATPAAKRGPKPTPKPAAAPVTSDLIDDISAVKDLVTKLGGSQVKKLVDLFE